MKRYSRLFIAALAAFGLASCSQELDQQIQTPQGNLVTVNFGAEAAIEGATKATLTPNEDDTFFKSAWENGDVLSVEYISPETGDNKTVTGTWTGSGFKAEGLPNETGAWDYVACYPVPDSKDSHIDFGSNRTQNGNSYNSIYDVMIGNKSTKNSAAGKDDDGSDIVFNMDRKTAVAYFHLTGGPADEDLVSATLSVEGGFIASQHAYISNFAFAPTEDLKEITITFPEKAPKASDFQLWYNVLPTMYTKMALTVETTGHTMTISRTAEGMYEAGKLYKVVKEIPADKWVKKGGETPDTKDFVLVTSAQPDWSGSYLLVGKNEASYYAFDESVYENNTWGKCSTVVVENSTIASTYSTMAVDIVPGTTENTYSILTPSGKYLSASAKGAFNLDGTYSANNCDFTISFDAKNVLVIKQASSKNNRQIRYNYNKGNGGLRWYEGTSVEPVYLYKGPSIAKYLVSFASVEGGTLSASAIKAEEGAEITLTAEPQFGYEFNGDWSVVATDGTVIPVADNKFTMPAQDVTVSGTFSKVAYTITKAAAENGSFIVKNGDAEVTTAFKDDEITLEATPAEGFTFGKWTVTYMDGETEKSFTPSANTFNMPAANVTVSATFVETAHVPVYASVADLIAAGAPTTDGSKVTVTLTDEEITKFYKSGKYTNGVYFTVGTQEVQIYCNDTPANWEVGGTISGTLTNCDWKLYKNTWELCPADYSELTYTAPLPTCATPEINIDEKGVVSMTCATDGATIRYTVGNAPEDPTETSGVFSSATLTDGQTIKAIAFAEGYKPSAVASKKYIVGGPTTPVVLYTLTPVNGDNNSYAKDCDVTVDGIVWNLTGNSQINPWRIGGKNITNIDRNLYSKTAFPKALTSIKITFGSATNITVNSCKLVYSTNADFTNSKECNITFTASSTVEVNESFPANAYYKLVLNVTNTKKDSKGKYVNGYAQLSKIEFIGLNN